MEIALIVLIVFVIVGSAFGGKDSRIDETGRRRRYLG
jgi:hypothetical protein